MGGRFWEFAQLSDAYSGLSYFDKVPDYEIYIGGVAALYKEPDPLKVAGITHVISAIDFGLDDVKELKDYERLWIQVDDVTEEDLLGQFRRTNAFIDEALGRGGKTFVHCAMGVSRSATVVIAWLMWRERKGFKDAFEKLRKGRPRVQPNSGFSKQLEVYEKMLSSGTDWDEDLYQRWKKDRFQVKLNGKL